MNTRTSFNVALLFTLGLALLIAPATFAHDGKHPDAPNPSPNATVSQEVGYGNVSIEYGRPGVKGREGKIWGELVKSGDDPRPWGGGANGNAVITFEEDVKINGKDLAAGSYGLLVDAGDDTWTFIFSKNAKKLGILSYKSEQDALRVEAKVEKANAQEWLAYEFEKTGELTATVNLHWENVKAGFTIEAPDHRKK